MKKQTIKKPRKLTIKSAVKTAPTKTTTLKKSDPNYYSEIGKISAQRRQMTSDDFANMAKKSHNPASRPNGYHGGRPKKQVAE